LFKEKSFEFRVKLMRDCEDRPSGGVESVAVTSDGGAEGYRMIATRLQRLYPCMISESGNTTGLV